MESRNGTASSGTKSALNLSKPRGMCSHQASVIFLTESVCSLVRSLSSSRFIDTLLSRVSVRISKERGKLVSLTGLASTTNYRSHKILSSSSSLRGLKLKVTVCSKSLSFQEPIERVSLRSLVNLPKKTG